MFSRDMMTSLYFQPSLLKQNASLKRVLKGFKGPFALFSDTQVFPFIAEPLSYRLRKWGYDVENFIIPAGENSKNRLVKEELEDRLFAKGFGRDSIFIAVGGGVITDLVGFLASTYCRGVSLILVPTTLLGMVDGAIGGKTGVNTPFGKNLIGSIYQPNSILIDRETLATLPQKEFQAGIAECIKHAALFHEPLFSFLEQNVMPILKRDPEALDTLIFESCEIKIKIVAEDEKEEGKRKLLNFGHTIGHALELLTHYQISHGQAIAYGMMIESRLFEELGMMKSVALQRLLNLLALYEFKQEAKYPIKTWMKAMALDKKSIQGTPRFVGIHAIGKPLTFNGAYCTEVPKDILKKILST